MTFVAAPYSRSSICQCGFPALHLNVPMGTVYSVDLDSVKYGSWTCGGCNHTFTIPAIWAKRGDSRGGWLPAEIFDLPSPGTEGDTECPKN